ncbi:helix-turn-helix domain-containing protein [Streptomyces avermitilis]|uniref:helix-turn-helix domain-containing protein n=1 Tax=Streptomyces avermitilis TaxID=33903 RepID=UPI0033BED4BC
MGAWQPLPDDLPSEVRHFVEQLRLLKDRTGLSLVALGARTAYSKSSWQRYLNATQPPPRQAVAALCRVAGLADTEAERFGVRWELAVHAWPRPPAPAPAHAGGPAGGATGGSAGGPAPGEYEDDPTLPWWDARDKAPEPRWSPTWLLAVAGVIAVALLLSVLVGALALT